MSITRAPWKAPPEHINFREVRDREKYLYITTNQDKLPDVYKRWSDYEDLILKKFGDPPNPKIRRVRALDIAWERRDRFNSRGTR